MEKMIEFVLSHVPLRLLSFYPLPVSVNQIIPLPCQHSLLVEQSKLICERALWYFFSPPSSSSLSVSSCASQSISCLQFFAPTASQSSSHTVWTESPSPVRKKGLCYCSLGSVSEGKVPGPHAFARAFDAMMNPVSSRCCFEAIPSHT